MLLCEQANTNFAVSLFKHYFVDCLKQFTLIKMKFEALKFIDLASTNCLFFKVKCDFSLFLTYFLNLYINFFRLTY